MNVLEDFTDAELKAELESRHKLPMATIKTNFFYRKDENDFRQLYREGYEDPLGDKYMTITGKVVRICKITQDDMREKLIAAGFNPGMVDAAICRQDTAVLAKMIAEIK